MANDDDPNTSVACLSGSQRSSDKTPVPPTEAGDGQIDRGRSDGRKEVGVESTDKEENPLYANIEASKTDEDACKAINSIDQWKKMVNSPTTDGSQRTPLHIAAGKGFLALTRLLIEAGANVDALDVDDEGPISFACMNQHIGVVRLLCEKKASVTHCNWEGWYPIHWAINNGDWKDNVVPLLLGREKECINKQEGICGWTPLNMATYRGRNGIVETLLREGADPTIQDEDGWTPVMTAAKLRNSTILGQLLIHLETNKKGENVGMTDNMGKTVLKELLSAKAEDFESPNDLAFLVGKILCLKNSKEISDERHPTVLRCLMEPEVSANDPDIVITILRHVVQNDRFLEDQKDDNIFGSVGGVVEFLQTKVEPPNQVHFTTFLLCWLARRVELHGCAQKILEKYSQGMGLPQLDIQPEKWKLAEWAIYCGLPQVLMNCVTATRLVKGRSDNDKPDFKIDKPGCKKIIDLLKKEKNEKHEGSPRNTPLPVHDRGKARDNQAKQMDNRAIDGEEKGEGEEMQALRDMEDILDFYLMEETIKPKPSLKMPENDVLEGLENFEAAVIQIRQHERNFTKFVKFRKISEVIYKEEVSLETVGDTMERFGRYFATNGIKDEVNVKNEGLKKATKDFTWIHLPSTNMVWMTDIMKKLMVTLGCGQNEFEYLDSFLRASWVQIPDKTSPARYMLPQYARRQAEKTPAREAYNHKEDSVVQNRTSEEDEKPTGKSAVNTTREEEMAESFNASALYMPFLSFSPYRKEEQPSKEGQHSNQSTGTPDVSSTDNKYHLTRREGLAKQRRRRQQLFEHYKDHPMHCSPTLDEFYYQFGADETSLEDRDARNKDQTVTKYLHPKGVEELDSWSLLKVNQLWIWTFGEKWMITSTSCIESNDANKFVLEILDHIQRRMEDGTNWHGPESPEELSKEIVEHCTATYERKYEFDSKGYQVDEEFLKESPDYKHQQETSASGKDSKEVSKTSHAGQTTQKVDIKSTDRDGSAPQRQKYKDRYYGTRGRRQYEFNGGQRSIRQIFSDSINRIGREEADLFRLFCEPSGHRNSKRGSMKGGWAGALTDGALKDVARKYLGLWARDKHIMDITDDKLQNSQPAPLTTERLQNATKTAAQLLFDIKDVRDELNIMKTVAESQLKVHLSISGTEKCDICTGCHDLDDDSTAKYNRKDIIELDKVAEQIQDSVRTTISLQESEIANRQAIEAVNQANIVTVFTVITLFFSPLSFMTSLFALDVAKFLEAPVWSLITILVIPLPFLFGGAAYVFLNKEKGTSTDSSRKMSSVELMATCEDQAIPSPIIPPLTLQPSATRRTIRSAKKVSHSDTKWDELLKDHLNRLYIRENHTLDEVVFELAAIHNIEIGKSSIERRLKEWLELSKNNVSQQHQQDDISTRRRTVSALTSLGPHSNSLFAQFPFVSLNMRRRQAEVDRIRELSPKTYLHQERMFHALDQLVKGLLASGQKSWTVDPVRPISFIAPNSGGRTEHASTTPRSPPSQDWEPLVEKCHGMATLAETSQFSELLSVFGNVLASTKQMVQTCTPNFLVYFWKVCIALFQVRIGGRKDYLCLRLFLHNLGAYLARSPSVGAHHAVTVFTASLIGVVESESLDLKVTLGLAYWKAIHVLASLLGGDHAIVLNMTTHCVRHWPGRFTPQKHVLESAYQELLSRKSSAPWALSEKDISLQLDYLRTVSAKKNYAPDVIQRADELRRTTRDISLSKATTGRLQATVTTRAFDFTTELLTAHHLEAASHARDADSVEASQAVAFGLLNTAIETFRKGSLECQIRAVAFSKRLEVHLRASGRKKQGLDEKDRGRDVRLAIKRAVMVPSWEPSFTPTMRRSSRPRASTKAAWAAQERRTRVESRDHLVCMLQAKSRTRIST
ncbi:uncharacterized protein CCOS01_01933 [Colletotrichum costaricense]|uniref:Clr5 domain-containing protein n=1 Tax=Colletotrichum costaricense TaxID=1209916 RepID=A0AAI9Z8D0_9PEZI|nr:uncharacterized protein CCOS01_01933 [Colletotrichum costaricense]KAK1536613.1 hypothetical protein CCOS01_01933 [Colletotrichum costaricense]